MASKAGWLKHNIAYKYLKSLKLIYTLPHELNNCEKNIVHLYLFIFKGISCILFEIKNYCLQFEEADFFRLEMILLIYEISKCIKTICQQLNYVVWVENNVEAREMKKHETITKIYLEDKCNDLVLNEFISFKDVKFIIKLVSIYSNLTDNNYE